MGVRSHAQPVMTADRVDTDVRFTIQPGIRAIAGHEPTARAEARWR